jgi:hypothetical protein
MSPIHELAERVREATGPLVGYAPGTYFCECNICGEQFEGDKRAYHCLPCAVDVANQGLAKLKALEIEVQAAKDFGGGFFSGVVAERTRQFYRDAVARRESAALLAALSSTPTPGKL